MENKTRIKEPTILTAKTFYWQPAGAAYQRRKNEEGRIEEVTEFFQSIGMEIIERTNETVKAEKDNINVAFYYSESCKNAYKRLSVYKDGKRSNIKSLRKLYN